MKQNKDKHGMLRPGGIIPVDAIESGSLTNDSSHSSIDNSWLTSASLAIVVVGASGDLAKKKTFPSLLNLYDDNLLPSDTKIWGFARSKLTNDDLRARLRPFLKKTGEHSSEVIDKFLQLIVYQQGSSYGDEDAFEKMAVDMQEFEKDRSQANRLFYFAIPPNAFADTAVAIKKRTMQDEAKGWTRLIVEKPFGRDLESFEELNRTLAKHFTEKHLYRIDHYLGKEMVQNLTVLRFSNTWFERVWNKENVQCIILTFKEPFGTEGRGGYFDKVREIPGSVLFCFLLYLIISHSLFTSVWNNSRHFAKPSFAGTNSSHNGTPNSFERTKRWKGCSRCQSGCLECDL